MERNCQTDIDLRFHGNFNRGIHALYQTGPGEAVLRELGVAYSGKRSDRTRYEAHYQGSFHQLPMSADAIRTTSLLHAEDRAELVRVLTSLGQGDPAQWQGVSVREWLDQATKRPVIRRFFEAGIRLASYTHAPDLLDAGWVLHLLGTLPGALHLEGGWQTLVDGLERAGRAAGATLVTGARVVAVEPGEEMHLFSLAYNMLGSVMDAEDCVQETFLRWYRARKSGEQETIRSPRSYLCTMVTHVCIDYLRSARVKRESYIGPWLPEPLLTSGPDEHVEMAEILSVASLRLLEALSPSERAAFLLRQVFDYEYEEIARIVGKSEHSCRQLVYRAKQHLASQRPRYEVSFQQQEQFYQSFLQASANGSMEDLLHLLAKDVVLYSDGGELRRPMPLNGAEVVARYLLEVTRRVSLETDWHWQVAMINGRPGVVISAYGRLYAVLTIELVDGRIQEIDFIVNPEKLGHLRQSTGNS